MSYLKKSIAVLIIASVSGVNSAFAQANYEIPSQYKNTYSAPKQDYNNRVDSAKTYYQKPLQGRISSVPAGSLLEAEIQTTLKTQQNAPGDIFIAKITQPLIINTQLIIPAGSTMTGQVVYIEAAGRAGKNALLDTRFISINLPDGRKIPIEGKIETLDKTGELKGEAWKTQLAKSTGVATVATGTATLAGLSIGAMSGHAAVGSIVGVSAGGALSLAWLLGRKGKDVVVPKGSKVLVNIKQPFRIENY